LTTASVSFFVALDFKNAVGAEIFFPELKRRAFIPHNEGDAFLIMDGCTAHSNDSGDKLIAENGIHPLAIPPHLSNARQPPDFLFLALPKRLPSKANLFKSCSIQTTHLSMITTSFMDAATLPNVISPFRNAGICLKIGLGPQLCAVQPRCV
jgi:hypothetical protein